METQEPAQLLPKLWTVFGGKPEHQQDSSMCLVLGAISLGAEAATGSQQQQPSFLREKKNLTSFIRQFDLPCYSFNTDYPI